MNNYTEDMVSNMVELYKANPNADTVKAIATKFDKSTRSVIAKLSRERVYITKPRATKTGDPIVSKLELVQQIEDLLEIEVITVVKSGKQDLQKLAEAIADVNEKLTEALVEFKNNTKLL